MKTVVVLVDRLWYPDTQSKKTNDETETIGNTLCIGVTEIIDSRQYTRDGGSLD